MTIRSYSKLEIATQQLDTALMLYFEDKNYFSVITLPGAAEEILAVYLKLHKQPNAFEEMLDSSLLIGELLYNSKGSRDSMYKTINRVKNGSKHMKGRDDINIQCNLKEEAQNILDRAVSNFYTLMTFENLNETSLMKKFNSQLVSK